jgi:molybdopterin-synthase adenylyltransferase
VLNEVGEEGQRKLLDSSVLIVGVGGLGSPAAFYLAGAGVGRIGLMDDDVVDLSNLQRQIAHADKDVGRPKVESAFEKLGAFNPEIAIEPIGRRLTAENAGAILQTFDFVIDASDNFDTKFLVADSCHDADKPYSHAGIAQFVGQTMTVIPGISACYRCIFEKPPEPQYDSGPPRGPLGVLPGVIGCLQATEAIKFIVGFGDLLTDFLLTYDALSMNFRKIPLKRADNCSLCSK